MVRNIASKSLGRGPMWRASNASLRLNGEVENRRPTVRSFRCNRNIVLLWNMDGASSRQTNAIISWLNTFPGVNLSSSVDLVDGVALCAAAHAMGVPHCGGSGVVNVDCSSSLLLSVANLKRVVDGLSTTFGVDASGLDVTGIARGDELGDGFFWRCDV